MTKHKLSKKEIIFLSVVVVLLIAIVILSVFLGMKQVYSYYDSKCRSFETQNANLSKNQIVFIGDSITDLCPLDDYYADLDRAVYNRGIGGDTTQGVLNRMKISLYDISPSSIVLMIGTNDINGKKTNKSILSNYREILTGIKTNLPEAQVICMSVIPQNKRLEEVAPRLDIDKNNKNIKELNLDIKNEAEKNGYIFIDLYALLADENDRLIETYSDDGLHLNKNGFAVWAKEIKPLLK